MLRALNLGDFLAGLPALRALSRAFPGHERILAAPWQFSELVDESGMERVSPTPGLVGLDPALRSADIAVDLHGRGPESQRILLSLNPGRLISFRCSGLAETTDGADWRADEHEVYRWCRMLQAYGIEADPTDLLLRRCGGQGPRQRQANPSGRPSSKCRPPRGSNEFPPATVIHPGAASRSRRWPPERFAAVAQAESRKGFRVVITGGPREVYLANRVAKLAGLPPSCVAAGRTSLNALANLIAGAERVVTGDTGIAHMASATATPSVVLFGPVPPAEWGPPLLPRHITLWAGIRGDPHGPTVDPGLLRITVPEVIDALARLPQRHDFAGG